jgi:hypothetical protein
MRESLRKSLDDQPGFERYPKGSIVICHSCAKPIFKLDFGIDVGDKVGRCVSAFKPVSTADVESLIGREDIDAGVRAGLAALTPDERTAHLQALHEMRTGDPMVCPCCLGVFVQVLAVTPDEVLDRAYTVELVTIPPDGSTKAWAVRGRKNLWVH